MLDLTILSPHRDDAAFSLSIALFCWSKLPVQLTVVNFFTRSEYAPHALSTRASTIATLRKREDRVALGSIDHRIRLESLELLDAPLRFGISADATSRPEAAALQSQAEIDAITDRVRQYFARGVVLAPLALGNHVDHIAVNRAAVAAGPHPKLGFYEDLPYATWTPESSLLLKLRELEQYTRVSLRAAVIRRDSFTTAHKRQIITKYHSQIRSDGVTAIVKYASNHRGGERIWIPKYGGPWKSLIQ
jgi:LmbE family N-acetylglucosaminyl deacetylase